MLKHFWTKIVFCICRRYLQRFGVSEAAGLINIFLKPGKYDPLHLFTLNQYSLSEN